MPRSLTYIAIGSEFGRLRVVGTGLTKRGRGGYSCLCFCGRSKVYSYSQLAAGIVISCGCYRDAKGNPTHGLSMKDGKVRPEHGIWSQIKGRCGAKDNAAWDAYGGRGIVVCTRWINSFENFYDDMGDRPSKSHSIERRDNDGPYSPENCYWATKKQQARNRRTSHLVKYLGRDMSLAEACELAGVAYGAGMYRVSVGKPFNLPRNRNAADAYGKAQDKLKSE